MLKVENVETLSAEVVLCILEARTRYGPPQRAPASQLGAAQQQGFGAQDVRRVRALPVAGLRLKCKRKRVFERTLQKVGWLLC